MSFVTSVNSHLSLIPIVFRPIFDHLLRPDPVRRDQPQPMFSDSPNTRRATPERVLLLFAAFALLAALSAVRDCRRRHQLETTVPAQEATVGTASGTM